MFPPQAPPPQAPGPDPMAAAAPPAPAPIRKVDETPIAMSAEDLAAWWSRIEQARKARGDREKRWEELLQAYLPTEDPQSINSNIHFRNTEQKKNQVFFKTPRFVLEPQEPLADQIIGPDGQAHTAEDVVTIKAEVLNKLLGPKGIDLKWLADEVLFELLQVSGWGPTLIAYEADFETVDQEVQVGTKPAPGSVLGLSEVPVFKTQKVDVPICEEFTWKKFSSKKLLVPAEWRSCRFDDAPWIGMEFAMPLAQAIAQKLVGKDFEPNATKDAHAFDPGRRQDLSSTAELVEGVAVWYRPAFFAGTDVRHRQLQRRLVLIKPLEQPAVHVKSPYQTLGPDGRLSADSMIGYPIHVFTLRDLSDSAYVPSDAAMTDPLVRQENTWASQDIALRDANIPRFLFDERLAEAIKKLQAGEVGDGASVETSLLVQGIEKLIAQLPHLEKAMADIQGRSAIRQAINETLALGPNQSGSVNTKVLSATEIQAAQSSSNVRGEGEQGRFISQVLVGVGKFDALVQRFATDAQYVSWVGRDGTKRLSAWNQTLTAGRWAYDIEPDSQLRTDAATERQQDIQFVNLLANAPEANRVELLRGLARKFGKDAARLIQPPPPKAPDQLKTAFSVDSKSLNPLMPESPIILEILAQQGIKVNPQTVQVALGLAKFLQAQQLAASGPDAKPGPQTEHGGALTEAGGLDPINKHAGAITGGMPGPRTM
jgi:hypothetical protein